jgi:nucleoside-diphosphate-sugar epimerase
MSKILLTGGMGFIGHNLIRKLKDTGHTPIVVDNISDYDGALNRVELDELMEIRKHSLGEDVKMYKQDIVHELQMDNIIEHEKPDTIIHLAAFPRAKVVIQNPQLGCDVILKGLLNLLESAKRHNVKRFVFISSSMIYGDFEQTNNPETASKNPIEPYGIMKLCAENLVRNYNRLYGLEYSIVRPSAVYGYRDVIDRVMSIFINRAQQNKPIYINGEGLALDLTFIDDAVDGIILCATNKNAKNGTFNITRGVARLLEDAGNIIINELGSTSKIIVNENDGKYPKRGALDISKAKELLGFNPSVDIEEGLPKYIKRFSK